MDEYVGKRAAGEYSFSRRSGITFRDQNNEDQSIQYHNRLGCSPRHSTTRGAQIGTQEKYKYARAPFRSMNGKAIAGSCSGSSPTSSDCGRFFQEPQNQALPRELTIAESSSKQDEIEDLVDTDRQVSIENLNLNAQMGIEDSEDVSTTMEQFEPSVHENISTDITESSFNPSVSKPYKQNNGRFGSGNQDASSSSFVRHSSIAYRNSSYAAKSISQRLGSGAERCGLKSLSCTSISDVLPSGCSSSDFTHHRRVGTVRKKTSDGESSAAKGKGASASSSGGYVVSMHTGDDSSSSSTDQVMHPPVSRRTRNRPAIRDHSNSLRTRRGSAGESQMRLPMQGDESILPSHNHVMIPQYRRAQFSIPEAPPESSSRSSHAFRHPYGRPGSSNQASRIRLVSHPEDISTRMFHRSLGDRDGYRRIDMEGVAEVLLALERMEQDESLTYEQLLVLETSLLFGGLSFHDQHRDLRMDIDNMSYEELLALEEKIGTVSTALSEEQLSKCLKRSIYENTSLATGITVCGDEDMKCSICQEEYVGQDEVGKLRCEHLYHATCIEQWLQQKNWCPICKSSALPSSQETG